MDNIFRTVRTLSAFVLFTLLGSACVWGQQNSEEQVVAVVDAFHEALVAGDSIAALSYLADDVTILESGGIENKEHYRSGHLAGDMRFANAVPRKRGEMKVSIEGDVAWAHSTSITEGRMGDREINSQGAELVVLAREDGIWKIKAIHWSSRRRK
jgi:ketosteroid isomerase-like protein